MKPAWTSKAPARSALVMMSATERTKPCTTARLSTAPASDVVASTIPARFLFVVDLSIPRCSIGAINARRALVRSRSQFPAFFTPRCLLHAPLFKRRPELGSGFGGERAFEQMRATAGKPPPSRLRSDRARGRVGSLWKTHHAIREAVQHAAPIVISSPMVGPMFTAHAGRGVTPEELARLAWRG
jgi:hypothetical protein